MTGPANNQAVLDRDEESSEAWVVASDDQIECEPAIAVVAFGLVNAACAPRCEVMRHLPLVSKQQRSVCIERGLGLSVQT